MKPGFSHHQKACGYSLLEVSVSLLLFGLILLMTGSSLTGLLSQGKRISTQQHAYRLAHNLMETLLALPDNEAKALHPEEDAKWTLQKRFDVQVDRLPYVRNPKFEELSVEYRYQGQSLIRLVSLVRHSS